MSSPGLASTSAPGPSTLLLDAAARSPSGARLGLASPDGPRPTAANAAAAASPAAGGAALRGGTPPPGGAAASSVTGGAPSSPTSSAISGFDAQPPDFLGGVMSPQGAGPAAAAAAGAEAAARAAGRARGDFPYQLSLGRRGGEGGEGPLADLQLPTDL